MAPEPGSQQKTFRYGLGVRETIKTWGLCLEHNNTCCQFKITWQECCLVAEGNVAGLIHSADAGNRVAQRRLNRDKLEAAVQSMTVAHGCKDRALMAIFHDKLERHLLIDV